MLTYQRENSPPIPRRRMQAGIVDGRVKNGCCMIAAASRLVMTVKIDSGFSNLISRHATPPPQIQRHPCQARQPDEAPLPHRADRKKGEVLGTVEAADPQAAEKVAAIQFELDEFQRRRLLVREIG